MNNEKEVQRFYLRHNPINGLTYMANWSPPIIGGTLYVLADDYDTLRRQLDSLLELVRYRYPDASCIGDGWDRLVSDMCAGKRGAELTEARLALAEQLLREVLNTIESTPDGIALDSRIVAYLSDAAIAAVEVSRD